MCTLRGRTYKDTISRSGWEGVAMQSQGEQESSLAVPPPHLSPSLLVEDDRDGVLQGDQRVRDGRDAVLRPGREPAQPAAKERLLLPPFQKTGKCRRSRSDRPPRGWGLRYLLSLLPSFLPSLLPCFLPLQGLVSSNLERGRSASFCCSFCD